MLRPCFFALSSSPALLKWGLKLIVQTVSPQLGWRLIFLLAFALFVGNAMKVCCRLFIMAQCSPPLYQAD